MAAPRLTAEVLLTHALRCEKAYLYAHPEEPLPTVAWIHFGRYLHERIHHRKPTQYITKRQEFYGREFRVETGVLIPRPETEHVVEAALEVFPPKGPAADIGCGSGTLAITLALETGRNLIATDISARALAVARRNAAALGADVRFLQTDLLSGFAPRSLRLIVANPPYIPEEEIPLLAPEVRDWEPAQALAGGPTGDEILRRLISQAEQILAPGGWLISEIDGRETTPGRTPLFNEQWLPSRVIPDLAGRPRVIAAQLR